MGEHRNADESRSLSYAATCRDCNNPELIVLIVGLFVVDQVVTGFAGGAAGVGLGGLYCSLRQNGKV